MRKVPNRVPPVTLSFWMIKVLATTVGETAADFLAFTLHLGLAMTSYIMGGLLLMALFNQFKLKRYVPISYWAVVVLISIVGTLLTDRLVDELGVNLITTTLLFSMALPGIFWAWYASEKTLAMHSIRTLKRELFYWMAILLTFALGTAAGDLLAETLRLGYALSMLLFAILIFIIALSYFLFRRHGVLTFWLAYILTRPMGASFGDLLSQPTNNGGLGLGTVGTSFLFLLAILGLVVYLSRKQHPSLENQMIALPILENEDSNDVSI